MKLFTNAELKDLKAKEQSREILRTQEMQKVADKARKNMATAEADFKLTLAKFKDQWAEEEKKHAIRIRGMSSEIQTLEDRKKDALIPISVYKKQAEEKMKEAMQFKKQFQHEYNEIEDLRELLEDKLDDVAERNKLVDKFEENLVSREKGIKMQEKSTEQALKELNKQMSSFLVDKEKGERDIKERKKVLFLKERSLLSKQESLKRTEKSLHEWSIKLKDERDTLDRIYQRQKK